MTPAERDALAHRLAAFRLRVAAEFHEMTAATGIATERIAAFGEVVRRGDEADFMELVYRYDELPE